MKRFLHLLALGVLACNSTGVGNPSIGQVDQRLIEDGTDALAAGDTSSSLNALTTLALTDPAEFVDSEAVAGLVAARTPLFFEPAGCLTTSQEQNAVSFTFDDCRTGAFGLLQLRGEMTATYTVEGPAAMGIELVTNPELVLGGTTVTLESQSLFTLGVESTTLTWNGRYQATRPLGAELEHESAFAATYDSSSQCLRLDGSATTLLDGEEGVETSVVDYQRCGPRGTCPAEGEVIVTRLPGRDHRLTLEFRQDDRAWVPELGVEVVLDCRR